jgi:hypothetical protein
MVFPDEVAAGASAEAGTGTAAGAVRAGSVTGDGTGLEGVGTTFAIWGRDVTAAFSLFSEYPGLTGARGDCPVLFEFPADPEPLESRRAKSMTTVLFRFTNELLMLISRQTIPRWIANDMSRDFA